MSVQTHSGPPSEAAAEQALAQLTPDQAAILAFNSSPALAAALGVPPARLQHETLRLLHQPQPQPLSFQGHAFQPLSPLSVPPRRPFSLRLRHECAAIGCSDPSCPLCAQAQSRRCLRDPAAKYLVGDALAAACGAPIAIEAVEPATGGALGAADLPGVALRVATVDAKRVGEGGSMEASIVGKHASKPLLGAHKHATEEISHDRDGRVLLPLGAPLSCLAVAASSEAVLGGQRPQFQILVTPIVAASGMPLPEATAPPLLTAGFVVATPRVRSAVKRDIPHLSDPISKLKAVGKATQTRLRDLTAALAETSGPPLAPPLSAVFTVGDFKRLVEWSGQDPERNERVKKGLRLTKGWEEACAHAAAAVGTDTRLRVWRHDDADVVFGAEQGLPQLSEGPLGVLKVSVLETAPAAASAVFVGIHVPERVVSAAVDAWNRPGHPGWSLMATETARLQAHAAAHPDEPLLVSGFQEEPPAPVVGRVMQPGAVLPAYVPPPQAAAPPPAGGDDALAFSLAVAAVQAMQIPNHVLESLLEGLQTEEETAAATEEETAAATEEETAAATAAALEATPLPPPTADALLRASGTLLRTLTPEWAKMTSLGTQEWQQLLQQAAEEMSGDAGGSPDLFSPPAKRHRDI